MIPFPGGSLPGTLEEHMDRQAPAVLVTGAGRGLGRGIAVEAARRGYSVIINYAGNREAAEEAAELCRTAAAKKPGGPGKGGSRGEQRFLPFRADISVEADRRSLADFAFSNFESVHALVNNAGVAPRERRDLLDADEESWERLMGINLKGPWFLTSLIASRWLGAGSRDKQSRRIIFVSSISAETVSTDRGEYCLSKAGIAMTSKLFAARLAAENIQVYELRPGIMATDMTSGVREKYDALLAEGLVPQGRWGTAEDCGRAAGALIDGDFAFSTGNVLYVDGGFHLSRL
jgi:NAD(P)-dependent dehydrogenase (short-subunit alcohol dehydrogenase family)